MRNEQNAAQSILVASKRRGTQICARSAGRAIDLVQALLFFDC